MRVLSIIIIGFFVAMSAYAEERAWRDKTGHFELRAELIGFNGEIAIWKKKNGEILAFPTADLSEADRDYLKSDEAASIYEKQASQTWTLVNGKQDKGELVSHVDKQVILQIRRNKLYVNDHRFDNLPAGYRTILPLVISQFENVELSDGSALRRWLARHAGTMPVKYECEGVMMAFENGDEYAVPYFLFSSKDRKFLEAGREEYRQSNMTERDRMNHSLYMQAMAGEYQANRDLELQIKLVQTQLLAAATGVADLWEVAMIPPGGTLFQAQSVIVPARSSLDASQIAAQQWPRFVVGPVRRLNRN